jgi:hypothetical protein
VGVGFAGRFTHLYLDITTALVTLVHISPQTNKIHAIYHNKRWYHWSSLGPIPSLAPTAPTIQLLHCLAIRSEPLPLPPSVSTSHSLARYTHSSSSRTSQHQHPSPNSHRPHHKRPQGKCRQTAHHPRSPNRTATTNTTNANAREATAVVSAVSARPCLRGRVPVSGSQRGSCLGRRGEPRAEVHGRDAVELRSASYAVGLVGGDDGCRGHVGRGQRRYLAYIGVIIGVV